MTETLAKPELLKSARHPGSPFSSAARIGRGDHPAPGFALTFICYWYSVARQRQPCCGRVVYWGNC
jgi:hypothetical protein